MRLSKYDYILLASNITKQIFIRLFEKNSKKPILKTIGYFKLDSMIKNYKEKKIRMQLLLHQQIF